MSAFIFHFRKKKKKKIWHLKKALSLTLKLDFNHRDI